MVNLLIIENDKNKCIDIVNNISLVNSNIRLIQITYNSEQAIEQIIKQQVDIIIVSEKLSDMTIKKFINNVISKNNNKKIVIIILGNSKKYKFDNLPHEITISIIKNPLNFKELEHVLHHYSLIVDRNIISYKISKELEKMDFKFRQYGTYYLIDTIYEIIKIEHNFDINISKEVYPIVAQKYNKSSNTIHSGIKNSFFGLNRKLLKEYLNYYNEDEIKLKDLIFSVAMNVKNSI